MCCMGISSAAELYLDLQKLPDFPAPGVAGPFAGMLGETLVFAGGANFPVSPGEDLLTVPKVWHPDIHTLCTVTGKRWRSEFHLDRPVAYGASVTTPYGIVCMGGEDESTVFKECFLLREENGRFIQVPLPDLPAPCAYGAAAVIDNKIYLAGGQSRKGLDSALYNFWMLDISLLNTGDADFCWQELPAWPGPARTLNLTLAQNNKIYVISGRSGAIDAAVPGSDILQDVYEFNPDGSEWRRCADIPQAVYAGTGAAIDGEKLLILTGIDKATATRPAGSGNSGFSPRAWIYGAIADAWNEITPAQDNQIVTPAIKYNGNIYLISGENGPRRRSLSSWCITPVEK